MTCKVSVHKLTWFELPTIFTDYILFLSVSKCLQCIRFFRGATWFEGFYSMWKVTFHNSTSITVKQWNVQTSFGSQQEEQQKQ